MTRDEKKEFVTDLCNGIRDRLLERIGAVPESWTGHELRQWVADTTADQAICGKLSRKAMRDYKNDVIVNDL